MCAVFDESPETRIMHSKLLVLQYCSEVIVQDESYSTKNSTLHVAGHTVGTNETHVTGNALVSNFCSVHPQGPLAS